MKNNKNRLVIIGSIDENVELVKRAKERGLYVIVCDGNDKSLVKDFADKTYDMNIYDVKTIAQMCIEEKADGIIGAFSDVVFQQITLIAAKAKLRWYVTPDSLKYYRNKYEQKKLLTRIGVKVPKFARVKSTSSAADFEDFSFPVVLKPIDGWGAKDICICDSVEKLSEYISSMERESEYEMEEYCDAYEYNTIAWLVDGQVSVLGIADRERNPRVGNKVGPVNRIVYPSKHMEERMDKVSEIFQKFVNATGQKEGPISMQFFYKDGEIIVCEIAGRVLGHEHNLIHYCGGSYVIDLLLDYVYGTAEDTRRDIQTMQEGVCSAGIYFICKDNADIQDLSRITPLFEKYGAQFQQIFAKEGHIYNKTFPYLAKCYLKENSRKELDNKSEKLYREIFVGDRDGKNVVLPFQMENRD